jgi:hypothetical protein
VTIDLQLTEDEIINGTWSNDEHQKGQENSKNTYERLPNFNMKNRDLHRKNVEPCQRITFISVTLILLV